MGPAHDHGPRTPSNCSLNRVVAQMRHPSTRIVRPLNIEQRECPAAASLPVLTGGHAKP